MIKMFKRHCNFCDREWSLFKMMNMDIREVEMIEKGNCPFCGEKLEEVK